jgi:redox-sensing transcriptional repressor
MMSGSRKKNEDDPSPPGVPKAVVNRLSLYSRELQRLQDEGRETVSSGDLGALLGFTDAQVRKDLAYFGQFGYPGIGYRTSELVGAIRQILGTNLNWQVVIVGIGNLGRALLGYKGFGRQGFHIAAALDSDPRKVGNVVEGITVQDIAELPNLVAEKGIKLGMIAVPAQYAQEVADRMAAAGIQGIVNFAPVTISLPEHVSLVGVDLAIELEQIAFAVVNRASVR